MTIPRPLLDASKATGATHVAGVDGGATKTLVAVLELETSKVFLGHGGPANVDAVGIEPAAGAIETALNEALAAARIEGRELGVTVFGLAGSVPAELKKRLEQTFSLGAAYFVNDVVTAWASGTWLEPGVGVISGTGSHVFGVNAAGESWRTGGWGHVLDDEGSGYWLGVEGMKAALHYRDASGPPTALLDAAVRFYELGAIEELQVLVYNKPLTKAEIAAFAREVATAAEAGDAPARSLIERGANELAAQVRAPVTRLGLGARGETFPVALIGSVFGHVPLFRELFEQAVNEFAPTASFVLPELGPIGGSLLLAVRAEGALERVDRDAVRAVLAADAPRMEA
jgi:glucosamine kinase